MDENELLRQVQALRKNMSAPDSAMKLSALLSQLQEVHSLARAGYFLRNLPAEVKNESVCFRRIKIAVISNFVSDEIANFLRADCLIERILPEVYCAGYDQYLWHLLDTDSVLYREPADITFCLLDEHIFLDKLPADWQVHDLIQVMDETLANLQTAFSQYLAGGEKLLVINSLVLSMDSYDVVIDYRSKMALSKKLYQFNQQLLELYSRYSNCVMLETTLFLQQPDLGLKNLNMSHYAKMHFSDELLMAFARECGKIARTMTGATKKCLVLDCDNTLWGGVIGDEGLTGIELGGTPLGEIYVQFQAVAKQLAKQGVILAINSKNTRENTDQVFACHPDSVLTATDFAWQCVNWRHKHENLLEIAAQLNIGTEHIVFVDDSDFECALVQAMLPEIKVVKLCGRVEEHIQQLLAPGFFNTLQLTQEDYLRGQTYRAESERKQEKEKFGDLAAYLSSLDIQVTVRFADAFTLPRLAQMTQRTNQFNLTTQRLSETEIEKLSQQKNYRIIVVEVCDKFGSSGVVGCVLAEFDTDNALHIRNFLLSCRVFSRGVETAVLASLISLAKKQQAVAVYGYYVPSSKNGNFQDFYLRHGFQLVDETIKEESCYWLNVVNKDAVEIETPWITLINQIF